MQPISSITLCIFVEDCLSPPDVGRCKTIFKRFYYNSAKQDCLELDYGGCGGNYNNYKTYSDCMAACRHLVVVGPWEPLLFTRFSRLPPLFNEILASIRTALICLPQNIFLKMSFWHADQTEIYSYSWVLPNNCQNWTYCPEIKRHLLWITMSWY